MKIVQLLIDELEEFMGFDAVALVNQPAHEGNFFAFKDNDAADAIAFQIIKNEVLKNVSEQFVNKIPGESKDEYISRCIPAIINEGYDQDQAAAICYSDWQSFDETKDPQEIVIGDYQTRHYDMCPGASALYRRIESGELDVDMGIAIRAAKLQDALFWLEKHTLLEMKHASFEDVKAAEILASEIMLLARMMGLEQEHQYVLGHVQVIRELYQQGLDQEMELDPSSLPDFVDELKETKFSFSLQEDQQIVVGPLMIPNKLIFRVDENGEPYYVYFTEDTIEKIARKMMREEKLDDINLEHSQDSMIDGHMLETWLIQHPEKDKQQVYSMNYPKGTWMGMYKVDDLGIWEKVKAGELKGFSVEGYFADRLIQN